MKYCYPRLISRLLLVVIAVILGFNASQAQTLQTGRADNIKQIRNLLTRIHGAADTDTKTALVLIKKAKILCKLVKVDTLTARACNEEGLCDYYAGNYKRSALMFDSAATIWKKGNNVDYFKALNDKGLAQMYNSDYQKALVTFFECLAMGDKEQNPKRLPKY